VFGQQGGDPASVAFDAAEAAVSRGVDRLFVDTAGRLHTQKNLIAELGKIRRVIGKRLPGAPDEVLLVVDANTGQNALTQARLFDEAVGLTGIVLTKLDGTARGGIVVAIARELGIPVRYVGVGEGVEDIARFDAEEFARGLLPVE
jgi:fused signal recognition particle receptor